MHVHLIGVSGMGMGALAALFRARGDRVTGSDTRFDPPIGPLLRSQGIECLEGYRGEHLDSRPDLVIVGNVIRKDNVEAVRAVELDLSRTSMSRALADWFLKGTRPILVAGTHGKTTTTALLAWVLESAGQRPGFFVGGEPRNLGTNARAAEAIVRLSATGATRTPFVVEADEYDAVYWEKHAKFLDYARGADRPIVIVTSVEHDHADIYPTAEAYEDSFATLLRGLPEDGLVVADGSSAVVRRLVEQTPAERVFYGLDGDGHDAGAPPEWLAAPCVGNDGTTMFDAFVGGSSLGRFALGVPGRHNVRNALAAMAVASHCGAQASAIRSALAQFRGVARRQDLVFERDDLRLYDDFAHHPTAVRETIAALRARHPGKRLVAMFEPRSATACRSVHENAYIDALAAADAVGLAPLGRKGGDDALDTSAVARGIGDKAHACATLSELEEWALRTLRGGDVAVVMSNGSMDGLVKRLAERLAGRLRDEPRNT